MWLYRLLLLLYPAAFRAEYGEEMRAVFAEKRRAAGGPVARLVPWTEAVADVFRHALPLHAEVLRQDLRAALRSLARSPGFAATVVGVAALGVGANTAVFTVADRVLVRPVPFPEPDRLVRVWESTPGYGRMEVAPPNYRDWRALAQSFASMAAYDRRPANLVGPEEPERVEGSGVTAELLPILGVQPVLGRAFTEADELPGADPVVVLSDGLWRRSFGGDPGLLKRALVLDDVPHTVVGVLPPDFRFPDRRTEYWTALRFGPDPSYEDRNNNYLEVVARLAPGTSLDGARAEMLAVMAGLEAQHPAELADTRATVNRMADEVPRQARLLLAALVGGALCVLLIACINLASLLLARALARRQELAVRSSLGAGPERLVRQLLTESLLLAGIGGVLGVALAYAALPALSPLVPDSIPLFGEPALDGRVLAFAVALTLATGVAFGVLPARGAASRALALDLGSGARSGGRRERLRTTLVTVQVAASAALLIASGLLIRALGRVEATDPGFRAEGVLTLRTWLPGDRYAAVADRAAFYDGVLAEVRALPGVSEAAYTSFLPIVMGGGIWAVDVEGQESQVRSADATASLRFVTPGYLATLGIPLLRGRDLDDGDGQEAPFVAVVSESFARRHWPDQDPLGRTFGFGFAERTVVGVVGDVRVRGLERTAEPQVYLPYGQVPDGWLVGYHPKDLAIRATGDPLALVPAVREIVRRADPAQSVTSVRLLEEIVAGSTAPRRVQLRVLGAFAVLAALLAAFGIHGLLSFMAGQREREIGVRLALGARRETILALVLRQGLLLGCLGATLGVLAGYGVGRAMQALLAGVAPSDAVTFTAASAVVLLTTVAGSLLPALRAARVDPNALLRG